MSCPKIAGNATHRESLLVEMDDVFPSKFLSKLWGTWIASSTVLFRLICLCIFFVERGPAILPTIVGTILMSRCPLVLLAIEPVLNPSSSVLMANVFRKDSNAIWMMIARISVMRAIAQIILVMRAHIFNVPVGIVLPNILGYTTKS